jgi:GTPase SAR1 family protein
VDAARRSDEEPKAREAGAPPQSVFDVTDRTSFDSLPRWLRDARADADPHCSAILVGNNSDLASTRLVSAEESEEFARIHDLSYVETSALEGSEIETVFQRTAQDSVQKVAKGEVAGGTAPPPGSVKITQTAALRKRCPC